VVEAHDPDLVQAPDEALRLEMFRGECAREMDGFRRLHGRAFLVLRRGGTRALSAPIGQQRTLVEPEPSQSLRPLAPSEHLVFPIRKTERSLIDRFYAVGQTRNNDVVIRDVSVSKFHAFFLDAEDGEAFLLQDARSTNGTFVNNVRVAAQGHGPAMHVSPGDRIRFGSIELQLFTAEELCALVRAVSARERWGNSGRL